MTNSATYASKFGAVVRLRSEPTPESEVGCGVSDGSGDGAAGYTSLLLQSAVLLKHSRRDLVAWSSNLQNELRRALASKRFRDGAAPAATAVRPWDIGATDALTSRLGSSARGASFRAADGGQVSHAPLTRAVSDSAAPAVSTTHSPLPALLIVSQGPDAFDGPEQHVCPAGRSSEQVAEELHAVSAAGGGEQTSIPLAESASSSASSASASASWQNFERFGAPSNGETASVLPDSTAAVTESLPSHVIAVGGDDNARKCSGGDGGGGDSLTLDCKPCSSAAAGAAASRSRRRDGAALRLLGHLYLGDMSAACNERYLCREGIDALVVVSGAPPPGAASTGTSIGAAAPTVQCGCRRQHSRARLLASLGLGEAASGGCYDEINKFIQLNRDARRSVLVCGSAADEQLAAAVAIQYAVKHGDLPLSEALRRMRKPHVISRTDLICLLQSVESRRALQLRNGDGGSRSREAPAGGSDAGDEPE